jgi:hypothetical protein
MATKIELFRIINPHAPEIVEKLIMIWGTEQVNLFIHDTIRASGSPDGKALPDVVIEALKGMQTAHNQEFPKFASLTPEYSAVHLANNEDYQVVARRIPRIAQRLDALWGHEAFPAFLGELMNDTRDGARQGFPDDVALALFKLLQKHEREFPQYVKPVGEIWSQNNRIY